MPLDAIAMHFHDTRGTALANVYAGAASRRRDVRRFGGRPRRLPVRARRDRQRRHRRRALPAAPLGIETGVDLAKVRAASRFIAGVVDHALTSKAYQAMEAAASALPWADSAVRAG